jgi:hypothetical protein
MFVRCVDISNTCITSSPKALVVLSSSGTQSALSLYISIYGGLHNIDKTIVHSQAVHTQSLGGYWVSHSRSQIFKLAKISFACSGALFEHSLRENPDLLSCPYASPQSASNFVNTAITGAEANAQSVTRSRRYTIHKHTVVGVALGEKPFLSFRDRSVVLVHWDTIPASETITVNHTEAEVAAYHIT